MHSNPSEIRKQLLSLLAEESLQSEDIVAAFLHLLQAFSACKYIHMRVLSPCGQYYAMVDSVGPYKNIGWVRRFRLLDDLKESELSYKIIKLSDRHDCKNLLAKFASDSTEYKYLTTLRFGLWVPLYCSGRLHGYVMLHWTDTAPISDLIDPLKSLMNQLIDHLPMVIAAARVVSHDRFLQKVFRYADNVVNAPTIGQFYDRIAIAYSKIWGLATTVYVGKPSNDADFIDVVAVAGKHIDNLDRSNPSLVPKNKGVFGYLLNNNNSILSNTIDGDERFDYCNITTSDYRPGSVIGGLLKSRRYTNMIFAVISVENDRRNFFDENDMKMLERLCQLFSSVVEDREAAREANVSEWDLVFTELCHDIVEPLQELMIDAEIFKFCAAEHLSIRRSRRVREDVYSLLQRADNIMEVIEQLDKKVKHTLDSSSFPGSDTIGLINLRRMIMSLERRWRASAEGKAVSFDLKLEEIKDVEVRASRTELELAFGHLIANAVKYSYSGKEDNPKSIEVRGTASGLRGKISIENFGVGIKPEEIEKIREKFYRGELARAEGRAGTGRGFNRANEIIGSLGGALSVESKYKGGHRQYPNGPWLTKVVVELPLEGGK